MFEWLQNLWRRRVPVCEICRKETNLRCATCGRILCDNHLIDLLEFKSELPTALIKILYEHGVYARICGKCLTKKVKESQTPASGT